MDRSRDINPTGLLKSFANIYSILRTQAAAIKGEDSMKKVAVYEQLGRRVYKHLYVIDAKGLVVLLLLYKIMLSICPVLFTI